MTPGSVFRATSPGQRVFTTSPGQLRHRGSKQIPAILALAPDMFLFLRRTVLQGYPGSAFRNHS